ncbi:LysR family transcriptional regulator [Streptomyces microflavus]|uniref:LysR family transcriptional regulator n=1 Tax=Streptomyces microflavus TaxID=1919 RepID=UPI003F4D3637
MDIRRLEFFVAIVDCGGFNRAAAALHVSQAETPRTRPTQTQVEQLRQGCKRAGQRPIRRRYGRGRPRSSLQHLAL